MRITWDLVAMNPDVYSIWNMRKEYIMNKKEAYDRQLNELRSRIKDTQTNANEEPKDESIKESNDESNEEQNEKRKDESIKELNEELDEKRKDDLIDNETATPTSEDELIEQFQKLCNDELELTECALLKNSKSYSAWQHRLWILGLIPKPNFKREFQLNEAYLQKDGRNRK